MVARVRTVAFQGIDTVEIDVQVHIASGLPRFTIVGLPEKAVAESRERVRAALASLGLALPPKRLTINLSPADLAKEGSHFDLPIALGLLAAMGVVAEEDLIGFLALGELALDGKLAAVAGVLPAAIGAASADLGLICPAANGPEAAWAGHGETVAAPDLLALINHFKGSQVLGPPPPLYPDLADIKGQESARRALEIAAGGGHNLLMVGLPGAGKSMLAARLPGILPPLGPVEAIEVAMVRSVAGALGDGTIDPARPFRDPHHSSSMPALIGGGSQAKPGEVSLAHCRVLFLDELAEFPRPVLDSLRQPIETGRAVISRANRHVTYPARFQLVAAMNPCRCGYLADPARACAQAPRCSQSYQARLSGPLLDRFDLAIEVAAVAIDDLSAPPTLEGSATIADLEAGGDTAETPVARRHLAEALSYCHAVP
ncbi:MAG: YifB family Mg chelatase-like AAA ATPase [Pseudomonadota bacterium]|nr:YifB family Mg chelatase-like AAA ATPase [Pseudomonadota bacterium]